MTEKRRVFEWGKPSGAEASFASMKGDTIMAAINSAQLESQLQGVNYPANKAELVRHVERNGADESICTVISSLPNQTYDSLAAVNRAVNALQQSTARQD